MTRSARMMLMSGNRDGSKNRDRRNERGERDYGRTRDNYDGGMYDKFRDDRGREHYDNGRYAPMRGEGDYWIEGRFRDRDGREHYDNGRFAPMKNAYSDSMGDNGARSYYGGPQMHLIPYPFIPPTILIKE